MPFHVVDATLNPPMLRRVISLLSMGEKAPVIIKRSNDRPNIHLAIEEMQHPLNSWLDLDRILKLHGYLREPELGAEPEPPLPFLVFTNKRKEAEEGCEHEWANAPDHYLKDKVVWFHSGMSAEFWNKTIEDLKARRIWGMLCTDAAGMVSH